ncbi:MAG: 4'-phosphopantetheinyl transferase superfamily protein [Verrucomicrobiae bacterium]|nr:4'-phosphopantetheinyl transferase superfamily protein [Verrucomicrobiae bacterium]
MTDARPAPLISEHPIEIQTGEIHLWSASLNDETGDGVRGFQPLLSDIEIGRANAFRFERDRRRFVMARGTLRTLLSRYTGELPEKLLIETGRFGKPILGSATERSVHFNLAHSGDKALYAISLDSPLGVDFEEIGREESLPEFAEGFCSPEELRRFEKLPWPEKTRALLRLWTAKEAFLKAMGTGLQIEPRRIEVPVSVTEGDSQPVSLEWIDSPEISARYVIHPFPDCEERLGGSAALAMPLGQHSPKMIWNGSL